MGLFDRSRSSSVTNLTDATTTNTTQTDQSGNAGGLNFSDVQGGVNVSLSSTSVQSDQGAIEAGAGLGHAGIGLARDSLSFLQRANSDSLTLLAGLASDSIDASRTIARDSAQDNADLVRATLGGFESITSRNSQSSDDRLVKVIGIALLAVVAAFVAPKLFTGGRAVIA